MKKYLIWLWMVSLAAFNVAAQVTEIHTFENVNKSIPDGNPAGVADTKIVPSSITSIAGVKVRLQVTGEFNGDLYGYITHDTGLTILLNRPGRTAASASGYADSGLDVTFDDSAANGDIHLYGTVVTPAPGSPLTGIWQPDGRKVSPITATDASPRTTTLGEFTGLDAAGNWTLFLADLESGGVHQLDSWELELTGQATPGITWPTPDAITYGATLSAAQLNASAGVAGTFTYAPPAGTVLSAGEDQTLSVTFTPTDTASYAVANADVLIDVLPAPLTITALNDSKTYGSPNPPLAASYSGFVNGDGAGDLDTPVVLTTTATPGSPVGSYPITANGAADANYEITFVPGTLTVDPAGLTITANDAARSYGAANPALTVAYSGFVNGDDPGDLDTPPGITTPATPASPTGSYPINPAGAADANYSITLVAGTLTINPAGLTITANNQSRTYGSANPTLTASYSGFVNGDDAGDLDTQVSLSTTATVGSPVGSYPITASGAADANYAITFGNGTLTVNPAALQITANNQAKTYGSANPTLTASYSGFVNGDDAGDLDTAASLSTSARAASGMSSSGRNPRGRDKPTPG
jgi:subtilisin-like proprotein convertase family protein